MPVPVPAEAPGPWRGSEARTAAPIAVEAAPLVPVVVPVVAPAFAAQRLALLLRPLTPFDFTPAPARAFGAETRLGRGGTGEQQQGESG